MNKVTTIASVLILGLLPVTGQAVPMTWTNGSDYWQSYTAWTTNGTGGTGGYPGQAAGDGAFFTNSPAPYTVTLTNDVLNLQSNWFDNAAGTIQTVTLNLDTNTITVVGNNTSAGPFQLGNGGNATSIVWISSSTVAGKGLFVTNSGNNARIVIGRSGFGNLNVTNGNIRCNVLILGNGGSGRGKVVLSGASTVWSNSSTVAIANNVGATLSSLIISNSATMICVSTFSVGGAGASTNSFLLDSGGVLMSRAAANNVGNASGNNNTATVQGGALWDNNNQPLAIGSSGTGNLLTIGQNATVSNVSTLAIAAGNALSLSGGLVRVSVAVSNTSATISGFGTIAGSVVFTGTGTFTPGFGTQVGTLTISNNLTLASTTTTKIKLDSSQSGSNDAITVAGTATTAGTLTVLTNGTAPLVAGDVYNIGVTGGFTTTNLPPLNGTYRWNNVTPGILAIVPQEVVPGINGPTNQVVNIGETVIISTTVTGVPTPGVYWQKGGVNVTDGANVWGSTNSGSATTTLTISNAQTNDSGTYCLIATNSVGAATNCMGLTVSSGNVAPSISGISDQTVIQGNNGTFNAAVAGSPTPSIQWFENGATITGATGVPLILTNVQFAQDGFVYSITASNVAGVASTNATLHVIVTPTITSQPVSLVVTDTQSASFSVAATGVPPPTYQWFFNNNSILNATNSTYTIASATISSAGTYKVQVSNAAGSLFSSNATLTVNSTMAATLTPSNSAINVCYDTPLFMAFDKTPFRSGTGKITIYLSGTTNVVETVDTSLGNLQSRTIGGETFNVFPVIITGNTAAIYPRNGILSSNKTYYVTVDPGTFTDTNGALFAGITDTNAWVFSTKPTGPANPLNIVVDAAGNGDFCTVQGSVDFVPANNGIHRLVTVRNGNYNELIDTRGKSNITFRGQSRTGTIVGYRNNDGQNSGTSNRMAFKVFGDDIAIENITITNRTPKGGTQAEAIRIDSNMKRFICYNATVASYQDTILGNTSGSQCYFRDSLVVGDTDFIWGGMNAFFTNCEIQCQSANSHVTQGRSDAGSNGMAFLNCRITRASATVSNNTCDLGRTLGFPDANVYFRYCLIDSHITGWSDVSLRDWEWGNSNLTATAAVTYNGIQTNVPCADDVTCWLYGWNPQLAPNIIGQPTNLNINAGQTAVFAVSATGIPDPTYQWLKNGTNVFDATSPTLTISNADVGDAGGYSVIVSNDSGSVTSVTATLSFNLTAFQSWQQLYFGCTLCPQAAAGADPDGDGLSNEAEFLAGTNPTDSSSGLRITSTQRQGADLTITWKTAGGRTNVVQATSGDGAGSYSNNFSDVSGLLVITGSGDQTTNYVDSGGATNVPSRYYRVRLAP